MIWTILSIALALWTGWHAGAWSQERQRRRADRLLAARLYRVTQLVREPPLHAELGRDEKRREMARWN